MSFTANMGVHSIYSMNYLEIEANRCSSVSSYYAQLIIVGIMRFHVL